MKYGPDLQFFGWGASLCIMSAFTSFTGIAIFRFILGAFEASISPSMRTSSPLIGRTLLTSSGRCIDVVDQARATSSKQVSKALFTRGNVLIGSIWYSANGLAAILGSLMTFGLGHADTGLYPYQLIFLVCGAM